MHKSVLSLVCCLFFFLSCQEEIETMPNGSLNIVLTDEAAVTGLCRRLCQMNCGNSSRLSCCVTEKGQSCPNTKVH